MPHFPEQGCIRRLDRRGSSFILYQNLKRTSGSTKALDRQSFMRMGYKEREAVNSIVQAKQIGNASRILPIGYRHVLNLVCES